MSTRPPALTRRRLDLVRTHLATLGDLVHDLAVTSNPDDVDTATEAAWAVYDALRDLSRPKPVTGCRLHPTGPIDPLHTEGALAEGWSKCLLCNTHRRRGLRPAGNATRPAAAGRA